MKQWWTKFQARRAERILALEESMRRLSAAVEQMRLEQWERREAKRLAKSAIKGQLRSPSLLMILVTLFLPDSYAVVVLGDLAETYPALRRKRGRFRAYLHVHKQVLCSIPPIIWQCIRAGNGAWLLIRVAWLGFAIIVALLIITIISNGGPNDMGFGERSMMDFPYPI